MNKKIRDFRDGIVKLINDSKLPIEVVRLVFLEIANSLNNEAEIAIAKEAQAEKQKEEIEVEEIKPEE